jgi:hypothetical protein
MVVHDMAHEHVHNYILRPWISLPIPRNPAKRITQGQNMVALIALGITQSPAIKLEYRCSEG